MKILAFTDSHANKSALATLKKKAKKVDLVLCCGDITMFGRDLAKNVKVISKLHDKIYLIHGNHESPARTKEECAKYPNIKFCHKKVYKLPGFSLFAYGGEGFCETNPDFAAFVDRNMDKLGDKNILMTHQPPFDTNLDDVYGMHVGCETVREYLKHFDIALSGHIHECSGHEEKIKKTLLMNPGPTGKIIEVEWN